MDKYQAKKITGTLKPYDCIVIGGGIIGAAVAYKVRLKRPEARILVLEKQAKPAMHQTGRNSGVIHSGLYYKPGSLKAQTCIDGYAQLVAFCETHSVRYELCGKLVAATNSKEVEYLKALQVRGEHNGLKELKWLSAEQAQSIEPELQCLAALQVPQTGIVDYVGMTEALLQGIELRTGEAVQSLQREGSCSVVNTPNGRYSAPMVVACAGLQSDRVARMDGVDAGMRIVPFRGDYHELSDRAAHKVKHLIYPVPDPDLPFLGVHFTRMVSGDIECGPNAVFSFARERYHKTGFLWKDAAAALTWPGTWKLFRRHMLYGMGEYRRAFSERAFLKALQKLIPSLTREDLKPGRSGIRAQALDREGKLVDDFVLKMGEAAFHVLNAPSPAATASLAIADRILKAHDASISS